MKKAHAKTLNTLYSELEELKSRLEEVTGEVRDAFESMSEKKQESEAGELAEQEADYLDEAVGALEEALDRISNAKGEDDDE